MDTAGRKYFKEMKQEKKSFLQGLIYGLLPHSFCILFVVFSVLGATTLTALFRPLLLNKNFFYFLIGLSFLAATVSAVFYLRRNRILSLVGIKRKWLYLTILYGTTILINFLLFLVVFPMTANLSLNSKNRIKEMSGSQTLISLQIDIPCSGHASLISDELKKVNGIIRVDFKLPNNFDVYYNPQKTNPQQILSQPIFLEFKATLRK